MGLFSVCEHLQGEFKEARARLFSGVQCQNKRREAQTGMQEAPSEHQETLSYCRCD